MLVSKILTLIYKSSSLFRKLNSNIKFYKNVITLVLLTFESYIFKACKEGKLTSVQWLIEKENVDINIKGFCKKKNTTSLCM